MNGKIRILIVDDEPIVRAGLRMRLELERDFDVVGEAEDGAQALLKAADLNPAVVVMDVQMPVMDGIKATQALRTEIPTTRVVILTMGDDDQTRERAVEAGAAGFVTKRRMDSALLDAIRQAAEG